MSKDSKQSSQQDNDLEYVMNKFISAFKRQERKILQEQKFPSKAIKQFVNSKFFYDTFKEYLLSEKYETLVRILEVINRYDLWASGNQRLYDLDYEPDDQVAEAERVIDDYLPTVNDEDVFNVAVNFIERHFLIGIPTNDRQDYIDRIEKLRYKLSRPKTRTKGFVPTKKIYLHKLL